SVTPTGAAAATLTSAGLNTTFNFSNVTVAAGGFSINGNGGSDQLLVKGTQNADTIDINNGASGASAVKVNSLLVANYSAMAQVEIDGQAGSDTFNVTPQSTTSISIDGGDPIGVLPGDAINLA